MSGPEQSPRETDGGGNSVGDSLRVQKRDGWERIVHNDGRTAWRTDSPDVPTQRVPRHGKVKLNVVRASDGWRLRYSWYSSTGLKSKHIGVEDTRAAATERAREIMGSESGFP